MKIKKVIQTTCVLLTLGFTLGREQLISAATISVDGNTADWNGIDKKGSDNANVAQWAASKDDQYVYLYIQQNGGNQWGMPIQDTKISVVYDDASLAGYGDKAMLQFTYMLSQLKDGYYADVAGAQIAYQPSLEQDKYEVEVAIPRTFFLNEQFSIQYCGSSVHFQEMTTASGGTVQEGQGEAQVPEEGQGEAQVPEEGQGEAQTPEEGQDSGNTQDTAVYNGITVDGNFSDWLAVEKKPVGDGSLESVAMVFDGDYVYLYIKEVSPNCATWSGKNSSGHFAIYTDTGRITNFKLRNGYIENISDAKVVHSNLQYEIAIPASALKQYKETISFGYYMGDSMFVEGVSNLTASGNTDKTFSGIVCDGMYGDWDFYPHELVEYSTPGGSGADSEAALYTTGSKLFGHVKSFLHRNEGEFQPFAIRFNEDESKSISFRLVTVDAEGNINMNPQIRNLANGTHEFYLWDLSSGSTATNISDASAPIYGKIYITVDSSYDEAEYEIDLEKLAEHFGLNVNDMKLIQAKYINIGNKWITIAGTSSGFLIGFALCGAVVIGAAIFAKKREKAGKRISVL